MIEFENLQKPQALFLQLVMQAMFDECVDAETAKSIFEQGFLMHTRNNTYEKDQEVNIQNLDQFVKGISAFVLGKFYLRLKREHEKLPRQLAAKVKAAFSVIEKRQSFDF